MIIFTDKVQIIPILELRFKRRAITMNLSSLHGGYINITPLITNIQFHLDNKIPITVFTQSIEFDFAYAKALENDPIMNECFMKMIIPSFEGELVVILIMRDEYRDNIMESLIKYIQQKYGITCWIIEDVEDIDCIKYESFSPTGIQIMDAEMRRYTSAYANGMQGPIQPINKE